MKKETNPITKDMLIGDVLEKFPERRVEIAETMMDAGFHCIGCMAAGMETIEDGAKAHGMTDDELKEFIKKLNASAKG